MKKMNTEFVRQQMWARGLTFKQMSLELKKSYNWVRVVMKGDYPEPGFSGVPHDFDMYFADKGIPLQPDGQDVIVQYTPKIYNRETPTDPPKPSRLWVKVKTEGFCVLTSEEMSNVDQLDTMIEFWGSTTEKLLWRELKPYLLVGLGLKVLEILSRENGNTPMAFVYDHFTTKKWSVWGLHKYSLQGLFGDGDTPLVALEQSMKVGDDDDDGCLQDTKPSD